MRIKANKCHICDSNVSAVYLLRDSY